MRRRTIVRSAVPAAALAAALAATTAASPRAGAVVGPPVPAPPWPYPAVCARGELTGFGFAAGTNPRARIVLNGTAWPCPEADPDVVARATLGVAVYHTGGHRLAEAAGRPFGTATTEENPRQMHVNFEPPPDLTTPEWGTMTGACLVTAPSRRVACVAIDLRADGVPQVTPAALADPRFVGPMVVISGESTDPECAACV